MRAGKGAVAALVLLLVAACAPPPPRPTRAPLAEEQRRFLLAPRTGLLEASQIPHQADIAQAHARLLAGDLEVAERQAASVLAMDAGNVLAGVLIGQVDLVRGRLAEAVSRLRPIADAQPACVAAQVALGRALELQGDLANAFVVYQLSRTAAPVASERADALGGPVAEQVGVALQAALDAGREAEVDERLGWLERWLPRERATVEARRAVAFRRGDLPAELSAVRRLAASAPSDRALRWRLGELELAAGDPGRGLEVFEDLARQDPGDPQIADGLAKARFAWRLATLPIQVQQAVRRPQLSRADLATLVYWLVPAVRAGRPSAGAIASDVLDHPRREEIVRVVNFGLMRIDDTQHLFDPGRLATRSEVNSTLARLLSSFGRGVPCTRVEGAFGDLLSRETACSLLARCRVVTDAAGCATGGAPSGGEVLDNLRKTLDVLAGARR